MNPAVVVVGSLNMDLVVRADRLPRAGETLPGNAFHTFPGGKGANQAVAASRLGAHVRMIGRVGEDAFGESLLQTLAAEGVDAAHVGRDPGAPTGIALITVDAAGQNTIVVVSGANGQVRPEDIDAAEGAFQGAAVLLAQFECPQPAVARAIEMARHHGLRVVLNPAPARRLEGLPLEDVDYLVPNQTELASLSGLPLDAPLRDAAAPLLERGVGAVVVTLGDQGVWVGDRREEFRLPAHRVLAVDTTAAGDAFVGAFAVALVEGRTPRQAAAWGNAAGALAVTRAGAQPSLPRRAELEPLLGASGTEALRPAEPTPNPALDEGL